MYARSITAALQGIEAYLVKVEIHLDSALPAYTTVGLPDSAVKESRERVNAAIKNSHFLFPQKKVTVSLAPASVKKEGSAYDLSIALAILAATGQVSQESLDKVALLGELALDGTLRPVRGALAVAAALPKNKIHTLLLPQANAEEAAMVENLDVIPVGSLREAALVLNGEKSIAPVVVDIDTLFSEQVSYPVDFHDVRGQEQAKRALEIAASGGHNILMIGPPGSGKTMLAKRLPSILPHLDFEEAMEVTKIYSVAGMLPPSKALLLARPFRSPHHTVSDVGLIGGGSIPRPGEVSLSHKGVLFLDEMPEFKKSVLEAMRQPIEDGWVTITRSKMSITFPSNFILVGAMNPCPCGYFGHPSKECRCNATMIQRYNSRLSGPLLDRIDIHIEVPAVEYKHLAAESGGEKSQDIRARVISSRKIQTERFQHHAHVSVNADMMASDIRKYCKLNQECSKLLQTAMDTMGLSARAYDRILKVSRTVADLDGSLEIKAQHVAEVIQYRSLDRDLLY